MMDASARGGEVYRFERFWLDPAARTLTRDGVPVAMAARLFETLLILVRHPGELVARETLLQAIWPGRFVEEGNLSRAVSSLREVLKAAGSAETLIVTVPGRGYRFTASVQVSRGPPGKAETPPPGAGARPGAAFAPAGSGAAARSRTLLAWLPSLVALAGVALLLLSYGPRRVPARLAERGAPPPHSVAVLPFADLGGGANETYFSDGLSDDLINALGRIGGLRVAGRLSSFSFKHGQPTVAEIGRQLNVGTVLEGSVRRDGGRVRVSAELIDVGTGYQIWSNRYERATGDMLAVEGEIAEAVIASLKIVLLDGQSRELVLGGTKDARAFDAYLAGMAVFSELDEAANREAVAHFDAAVAADPGYALAFAQRAKARLYLSSITSSSDVGRSQALMALAQQDAERAVALAPTLGAAHAALGLVLKFALKDMARAEAETARALELAPGDAGIMMDQAGLQMDLGRLDAAVDAAERAAALDPLSARSYRKLAVILACAGRYADALVALDRARRLQPEALQADRSLRSAVQTMAGDVAGARATCGGDRDYRDSMCLAWVYHKLGDQASADIELAKLKAALGDNGAYLYAHVHGQMDQPDEAMRWLQAAYRLRDPGLIIVKVDPALAALRTRPAYEAILRGLGFP